MTTETAIHRFVSEARAGRLARVISRVRSGWAVLGDPQILPGYCVLYPDPVVTDLHQLPGDERAQFLNDMADLGAAVLAVMGAARINYELLGNVEPRCMRTLFRVTPMNLRRGAGNPSGCTTGTPRRPSIPCATGGCWSAWPPRCTAQN